MKKQLLPLMTGGFMMACAISLAQPVLTATTINPVIGENFPMSNGNYVSPGASGAGQTWNLSSISGTPAGTSTAVTPSSTPDGSSFTSANVALQNTSAGYVLYYKTSSTALQNYGVSSGGTVIPYSNPEDFLHFPFSYTNTFSDTWAGTFVSSGYTFYRTGTTTVTADGYGTLTTPNGSYTNVMRVHFVQVYQDSAYIGTPYVVTYNNDEYMWYRNGAHTQIATVYTLTTSAGGPYTGSSYVTGTVGVNEEDMLSASSLYPNPASDLIQLDLTLKGNKEVSVYVYNALGQKTALSYTESGFQGANQLSMDVATLPEGIYFAEISLDGIVAETKRFIVSR